MKTKIDFGLIDFYGDGKNKRNRVDVELELKETPNGEEFSASANVWNSRHSDIICGGQCLDTLAPFFKNNLLYIKILNFWEKYHLNGMHPECEHQHALNWHEQAREKIKINKYTLTHEAIEAQNKAEKRILNAAKHGQTVQATEEERKLLNLNYIIELIDGDTPPFGELYKLRETEEKTRGWLDYEEYPKFGILGKPCPVCGYKYGNGWKFFAIPAKDLAEIKKIIQEGGRK